jgi:hypothetical protein
MPDSQQVVTVIEDAYVASARTVAITAAIFILFGLAAAVRLPEHQEPPDENTNGS